MAGKFGFNLRHVALGVAAAMAFTGAFTGYTAAEEFKIGRIVKQGTHPYFTAETVGMRAQAEELGVELLYQDVETDVDLAISALDTMIAAGVDAIAITVPDQSAGPAVMSRAKEAGIGAVVFDRNGYRFHGRIKAMADAVRAGGVKF